jgi:hypothetical protein
MNHFKASKKDRIIEVRIQALINTCVQKHMSGKSDLFAAIWLMPITACTTKRLEDTITAFCTAVQAFVLAQQATAYCLAAVRKATKTWVITTELVKQILIIAKDLSIETGLKSSSSLIKVL